MLPLVLLMLPVNLLLQSIVFEKSLYELNHAVLKPMELKAGQVKLLRSPDVSSECTLNISFSLLHNKEA